MNEDEDEDVMEQVIAANVELLNKRELLRVDQHLKNLVMTAKNIKIRRKLRKRKPAQDTTKH